MKLYENKFLRQIVLSALAKVGSRDIYIRHHYTGSRFYLHLYKHKGYWYHGQRREKNSMAMFKSLIEEGHNIVEVGGHIGYISLYFASLVGKTGNVYVFEPGVNNLPYLEKNICHFSNIHLTEKAVSNFSGTADFYIENLTGQNNTLDQNYSVFQENVQNSYSQHEYQPVTVEVISLDEWLDNKRRSIDFVKIDVEGEELNVLSGMTSCLEKIRPILMVEVTKNSREVYELLLDHEYILFDPNHKVISTYLDLSGNVFALHSQAHIGQIQKSSLNTP